MNTKTGTKKLTNIFIYILSLFSSVVGIGLNFFLARVLQADEYGKIQYLVALATTIYQVLIFGLGNFLIREAKNDKFHGQLINKCLSLYSVILTFAIPIIYHTLIHYTAHTCDNVLLTVAILIMSIMMGFNALIASHYQGNGKYHISIIFERLIPKSFLLVLSIFFMISNRMAFFQERYIYFYVAIYSIIAIPFIIMLFKKFDLKFSKSDFKSITFFFGVTVTYSLGNNLTQVIQGGIYHNNIALAIISVSVSITGLMKIFTSVIDNLIKPIFSKRKRENNQEAIINLFRFDTRMNSYIGIPLYLFFIFHSKMFLSIFGESYTLYSEILTIISVACMINDLTGPTATMLAMVGKEKWELYNGILYILVYIVSAFAFSFDPVYGLCYALLSSQVVVNLAKYIEVWHIFKKPPIDLKTILTIIVIFIVNGLSIFALSFINSFITWLLIGIAIGIVLVLLNVFVLSFYRKNDFKYFINLRL